MSIQSNRRMVSRSLTALSIILALAGAGVAGATAGGSLVGNTVDAWRNARTLGNSDFYESGSRARYPVKQWPPVLPVCKTEGCALAGRASWETDLAPPSNSSLETSMKWRSNSFSIAGSRDWSRLIVLTSTSINVRVPLN